MLYFIDSCSAGVDSCTGGVCTCIGGYIGSNCCDCDSGYYRDPSDGLCKGRPTGLYIHLCTIVSIDVHAGGNIVSDSLEHTKPFALWNLLHY